MNPDQQRPLPHSLEAEQAVLGAILMGREGGANELLDSLPADAFYHAAHRDIYQAIADLTTGNKQVDLVAVTQRLRDTGKIESVGGAGYITDLLDKAGISTSFTDQIAVIREKWIRQRLIAAANEAENLGYTEADDLDQQLDTVQAKLFELSAIGQSSRAVICDATAGMTRSMNQLVARLEHTGATTGLPTGLRLVDHMTGGLQPCDLILIAARTSMGKSALMFNVATELAVRQRIPVGVLSLEMSTEQVINRVWSDVSQVDGLAIREGKLSEEEFDKLTGVVDAIKSAPLYIDDTPNLSLMQVRAKARRLKAQHDIQLLVLDYLQIVNHQTPQTKGNRELEVSLVCAGVKALAKELRIPILAGAQLNRKSEDRGDQQPRLADLRESGGLEMHADVVILLHRPEQGASQEKIDKEGLEGKAYATIAKQRNGPTGEVPLTYLKRLSKFVNQAPDLT